MNCFCRMGDYEQPAAVFPERLIIRKPHHHELPVNLPRNAIATLSLLRAKTAGAMEHFHHPLLTKTP